VSTFSGSRRSKEIKGTATQKYLEWRGEEAWKTRKYQAAFANHTNKSVGNGGVSKGLYQLPGGGPDQDERRTGAPLRKDQYAIREPPKNDQPSPRWGGIWSEV